MRWALPFAFSLASGYFVVASGVPRRHSTWVDFLLRWSLGAGLGVGISSVVYFLDRVSGWTSWLAADCIALLLLACFFLLRRRVVPGSEPALPTDPLRTPSWLQRTVAIAMFFAIGAALYSALMRVRAHPHGDGWDAFAIWNLHARFLFLGGAHWRDGFSALIPWSHPDYPLLLPAAIAHVWRYLGNDDPKVPAAIGLIFTFSTVALLYAALGRLRGTTAAMLGTLALVSTPFFIEQGTSQYADVPLSFYFLATIVLLSLFDRALESGSPQPGFLVLAGLSSSFAAWTKNEGLLFLCSAVLIRAIAAAGQRHSRAPRRFRFLLLFLFAAAPVLLLATWFKHSVAPAGDLFSSAGEMLHKILIPERYWVILKWYAKELLRFGGWFVIPISLLLPVLYFSMRRETPSSRGNATLSIWILLLTVAGYFAVYLVTPYDLYWHLRFSLNRLFLQLWPSTIFLFFVALPGKPAKAISK